MMLDKRPYTFDRVIRALISIGILLGLIWLLDYLSDALIPFAVALLLAYMINPLVTWIEKKIHNRLAAVLIGLLTVLLFFAILAMVIIPMIVGEISHMGRLLSQLVNDTDLAQRADKLLPSDIWQTIKEFAARAEVQEFFRTDNFWTILETVGRKLLPGVWGLITGTASFLAGMLGLGVIGLYLVFLLLDYERISTGWKELIPPGYRDAVTGFVSDFETAMSQYFRGQTSVAFMCGVLFSAGFVVIGLPLGVLLGMFVGLLNMVPYLQIIGFIPAFMLAVIHALESNTGIWMALGLTTGVFALVQLIQDGILVPRIMGKVTGLNPAMIMLALSIWGKLLGLLGLIIALPMTYLLLIYYRRFLAAAQPQASDACR
jgi:predicted PurR-regulated permease PerM